MDKKEARKIRMLINDELDKKHPDKEKIANLRKLLVADDLTPSKRPRRGYKGELKTDIKKYIELRNQGLSRFAIADLFEMDLEEMTRELSCAVRRKLIKKGDITTRRSVDFIFTKEMYLAEREKGLNDSRIREKYGLNINFLTFRKREWGIPLRRKKSYLPKEDLIKYILDGMRNKEIAEMLGLPESSISNAIHYYQINKKQLKRGI